MSDAPNLQRLVYDIAAAATECIQTQAHCAREVVIKCPARQHHCVESVVRRSVGSGHPCSSHGNLHMTHHILL